jgi:thymidylate synthase (FAD)
MLRHILDVGDTMYRKSIKLYNDEIGKVDYVSHMGDDLTVVNSARVSFGVEKNELDQKDKKLINYLIRHRHTSTLEHNLITFRFTVPLFVRSQHHRHRTWSYNEISRRYTDINIQFYEPDKFRTQHKSNRQASNFDELIDPIIIPDLSDTNFGTTLSTLVKQHHKRCLTFYEKLINVGVCREQARGVLPQNLYTEYYGTVNLNNLLKFINLRTHEGAQWEIQEVAKACLEIAADLFPETISAYQKISDKENHK